MGDEAEYLAENDSFYSDRHEQERKKKANTSALTGQLAKMTARAEKAEKKLMSLQQEDGDLRYAKAILRGQLAAMDVRAEKAEKERDAAINDILCNDHCDVCKFSKNATEDCRACDWECSICKSEKCGCRICRDEDKWQWRGPQEDKP